MEYASHAVGAAGLTTGIIGTALGALNGGLLGNIGLGGNAAAVCSENHFVNRYEAAQASRIAELETEVKLRDANVYAMSQVNALRDYMENRFTKVESEICDQKVFNATAIANIGCIQGQIAQLMSLTKLVVPNGSVCPGWGDVTITPAAAPSTGA